MTTEKYDLAAKLAGIYRYLCRFEQLASDFIEYKKRLEYAESAVNRMKKALLRSIVIPVAFLGIAYGILYWSGNIQNIASGDNISFPGFLGFLKVIASLALLAIAAVYLIKIPVYLIQIPKRKNDIIYNQKLYNKVVAKFAELFDSMKKEKTDTEELFHGHNPEYPSSRQVKYAMDSLNGGQADDYKEVMELMSEFANRERMEAEAEKQARFAQQAAIKSMEILVAARDAEIAARRRSSDASSARWTTYYRR